LRRISSEKQNFLDFSGIIPIFYKFSALIPPGGGFGAMFVVDEKVPKGVDWVVV